MPPRKKIDLKWLEQWQELRGIWRTDAVLYAKQRLGLNPTWQQRKILEAVTEPGAKVSVRSGHGIGKSGSVSAAIWWKLECFDYPKIPCTAPSASQLRDVLWAELAKWQRRADEIATRNGLPPELFLSNLFKVTQDKVCDVGAPDEWFAVARTARPENPDALQGFHASDVVISEDGRSVATESSDGGGQIMFVVEEASGVSDKIFEVAEGALSSHGATLLMVGNPTRNTGYFAGSHKRNRADFRTLHFRSSDSPLVDASYRERLIRKFGEGSNVVRVRADGEFPKQDDDTLISLEDAEAAIIREALPIPGLERRLGVDVARFGDDRTVLTLRVGNVVEHIKVFAKQSTMETAGKVKLYAKEWEADSIYVDVIGVGSGVYDRLAEQGLPVVAVNVSVSPPNKRKSSGGRPGKKYMPTDAQPFRLRDYLWMEMANWMVNDCPSFRNIDRDIAEDLAGELASVRYAIDSSGRLVVESKDAMKKRGLRSPDIADSLMVTFSDSAFDPDKRGAGLFEFMRQQAEAARAEVEESKESSLTCQLVEHARRYRLDNWRINCLVTRFRRARQYLRTHSMLSGRLISRSASTSRGHHAPMSRSRSRSFGRLPMSSWSDLPSRHAKTRSNGCLGTSNRGKAARPERTRRIA